MSDRTTRNEIERLRNEYIDAAARARVYRYGYADAMKPKRYHTAQHAEITAARALLAAKEATDEQDSLLTSRTDRV